MKTKVFFHTRENFAVDFRRDRAVSNAVRRVQGDLLKVRLDFSVDLDSCRRTLLKTRHICMIHAGRDGLTTEPLGPAVIVLHVLFD